MEAVSPIIDVISRLWNCSAVHGNYLCGLKKNVSSSLTKLKDRRDDVKEKVERSEENPTEPMKRTHEVSSWLIRVEALEQEVEGILCEQEATNNQRGSYLCCWGPKNCCSAYKFGKLVAEKTNEVENLLEEGKFNTVVEKSQPEPVREIPTVEAVGMESRIEEIWSMLADETSKVRIVGLYGMGGVGKTTLLANLNNEFLKRNHHFDKVIWVTVSRDRAKDIQNIQKQIGKSFGFSWSEETIIADLAKDITQVLKNKKFVLLLDDIWEEIELETVGVSKNMIQRTGSKVLFTTRKEQVCGCMDADKRIRIECLDEDQAWSLFQQKVKHDALSCHPDVPEVAKKVAKECRGLPLALITIGRTMSSKTDLQQWQHALHTLRESASKFSGMAEKVLATIKFSYDNLENQKLKSCFLYCSLYPEDCPIYKVDIIGLWIGEGFLDNVDDFFEARNEGHDVIRCLKDACLLETGDLAGVKLEYLVKMHDVVRDLAIWITSDLGRKKGTYLTLQAESTLKLNEWEKAERISLIDNTAIKILNGAPRCSNLSTLILRHSSITYVISDEFFQFMPMLKVLHMGRVKLKKPPTSMFSLSKLQSLDMPEYDEDVVITPGSFASLPNLKVLCLSQSCCHWEVEGGPSLLELESLKYLIGLQITIGTGFALQRLVTSPKLQLCTQSLRIKYCPGVTSLTFLPSSPVSSPSLAQMSRLIYLFLKYCDELEELRIMGGDQVTLFTTLEYLSLSFMPKLVIVWDAPQQSTFSSVNLKHVLIEGCPQLKEITWLIYAPNLEILSLVDMDGLEEIISDGFATEEKLTNCFSRLKFLGLVSIRNLRRICDPNVKFSRLEKIRVRECPELKKLPFNKNSVIPRTLKIHGEKEWWESLEWEDEATVSNLGPHLKLG